MKLRTWIIAGLAAAGIVGGVVTHRAVAAAETAALVGDAEPGQGGPLRTLFSGQVGRLLKLRSELDLTADQKKQIKAVLVSHRAEIATVAKPIIEKKLLLQSAVTADKPDEAAIRKASADLATSIGDAAVLAAKVRGEVWPVFTPEQREKIEAFRKDTHAGVDRFLEKLSKPAV